MADRIEATGAKKCNDCRWDMPVQDISVKDGQLVVVTKCEGCGTVYTSKFKWTVGAQVAITA